MSVSPQRRFPSQKAVVRLLDSRCVEISLHARLSVEDVLQRIAEQCDINPHDSRFFGLAFADHLGYFHWLENSLILSDLADQIKENKYLLLSHNVRFFVDSVYDIQCASTAKFYFLEVHNQIVRHELTVSEDVYIELMASVLTVYAPDFSEEAVRDVLRHILPHSHPRHLLLGHDDVDAAAEDLERRVVDHYNHIRGRSLGLAIVSFLSKAEVCDSYGYRFYEVFDDGGRKCLLALGSKGIFIYSMDTLDECLQKFHWRQLDNLYYRETKFSIEIRDTKRDESFETSFGSELVDEQLSEAFSHPTTQVSTSRRRSRVFIYNFRCETSHVCRTIWSSSIAQHQFFLERRNLGKKGRPKTTAVDHIELSEKLNRLTSSSSIGSSLPSLSSLHSTSSASTMPSAKIADGSCISLPALKTPSFQKTDEDRQRDVVRYREMLQKRAELEETLIERLTELKAICVQEGELTGAMPDEMQNALMPGEDVPRLKRRVGTSFSIPEELIRADKEDKMGEMETTVELHRRIVAAASRLATDKSTNKSVRKKRQKDLQAAKQKLNRLEQGLQQMRHSASKPDISSFNSDSNSWTISSNGALTMAMTKSCPTTPRGSVPDLSSHTDGERNEAEEGLDDVPRRAPSTAAMRALQQQQRYSGTSSSSATSADSMGLGLPPRPNSRKSIASCSHADPLDNPLADPTNPLYENVGYRSTSYRSSYRQAHYPTIQDEHHQRKRAQSAHSIALEPGSSGRVPCSYSIPMQDATQRFAQNDQDDVTPTAENPHPIRRLPTSISCGAGLGTASLDRRNGFPRSHLQTSEDLNRRISPPTHRITTFPVSHPTSIMPNRSYSTNSSATEMPRFQPPPSRLGPFPSRVALPPYNGVTQKPSLTTVSASKLPVNTNPQMEALLHYYKQQKRNQQPPKTATIV